MEIYIRRSEMKDLPELTTLMQKYMNLSILKPNVTRNQIEEHIIHLVDSDCLGCQLVAEIDQKIVGFATLYYSFSTMNLKKVINMNDLFVDNDYRGLAIGKKLIQECIFFGEKNNCASMVWETHINNLGAQKLYDSFGERTDSWIHYEKSLL
ncbi:GNAT family N-acetyltransferase [Enterococcus sp. DIV0242_7C1]|uniref:N-acetyltransferase domain-containing protein n=1 Tax=Candidatus Enterococcus dunnyi TaxID=1834192 RepID=A0A200ITS5_9ENTE|nr:MULTISPECIES: GNAT family N-acetyltransferase [unclassified Enterococcus]MBO0471244.1 GNAT family N-acetyltransferase [Enterococcus sp. DIV0242_7C1]OUZ28366.1 hypothetical protein A5889_003121 [Enterococcus sp. 9D6_DIV0238]